MVTQTTNGKPVNLTDEHNIRTAEAYATEVAESIPEDGSRPKRGRPRKENAGIGDASIPAQIEPKRLDYKQYEMPPLPDDYFWRVRTREDEHYGTTFIVSLRKKRFLGSRVIDSVHVSANEYSDYFQGSPLNDADTLSRTAATVWRARSETISRREGYQSRKRAMKRYKGDYDAHHLLSDVNA